MYRNSDLDDFFTLIYQLIIAFIFAFGSHFCFTNFIIIPYHTFLGEDQIFLKTFLQWNLFFIPLRFYSYNDMYLRWDFKKTNKDDDVVSEETTDYSWEIFYFRILVEIYVQLNAFLLSSCVAFDFGKLIGVFIVGFLFITWGLMVILYPYCTNIPILDERVPKNHIINTDGVYERLWKAMKFLFLFLTICLHMVYYDFVKDLLGTSLHFVIVTFTFSGTFWETLIVTFLSSNEVLNYQVMNVKESIPRITLLILFLCLYGPCICFKSLKETYNVSLKFQFYTQYLPWNMIIKIGQQSGISDQLWNYFIDMIENCFGYQSYLKIDLENPVRKMFRAIHNLLEYLFPLIYISDKIFFNFLLTTKRNEDDDKKEFWEIAEFGIIILGVEIICEFILLAIATLQKSINSCFHCYENEEMEDEEGDIISIEYQRIPIHSYLNFFGMILLPTINQWGFIFAQILNIVPCSLPIFCAEISQTS